MVQLARNEWLMVQLTPKKNFNLEANLCQSLNVQLYSTNTRW